jgi:hypothetical protein
MGKRGIGERNVDGEAEAESDQGESGEYEEAVYAITARSGTSGSECGAGTGRMRGD